MPANREIWVIGDKLMIFVSQHLEYWKELTRKDPHQALHILRWYDVKAFPPHTTSNNAVEVILNSLVGVLNNRPKLPHIIIVMLGDVKFWCDQQALKFTMDTIIKSLIKEIKRVVETRQRDLPLKVIGPDPPIFFVKLNWKPENALHSVPLYPKQRRTFNKLLDSMVRPRGGNTITLHKINDKFDKDLFLGHGDLSEKGYRQIWKSLSEAIEDFENFGHQQRKDFAVLGKCKEVVHGVDQLADLSEEDTTAVCNQDQQPKFHRRRQFKNNFRGGFNNRKNAAQWQRTNFGQSFFQHKF